MAISIDEYWRKFIEYFQRQLEEGYAPKKALIIALEQTENAIIFEANEEGKTLLKKLGIEATHEIRKIDREIRELLRSASSSVEDFKFQIDTELWEKEYLKPDERKDFVNRIRDVLGIH